MTGNRNRECALLAAIGLLVLLPVFAREAGGFYSVSTFAGLVADNLPVLLAAIGMTIVIVCGQIDISVGSQLLVCGVVAGHLPSSLSPCRWLSS